MTIAVWGHLSLDVPREGCPEAVMARCERAGINIYLAHAYPMDAGEGRLFGRAKTVQYNSAAFEADVQDTFTPLLAEAKKRGVEVEPWLMPFDSAPLKGETPEGLAKRTYQPMQTQLAAGTSEKILGKVGKRLCPSWPENRERGIRMLHDFIEQHGADMTGIHLDAIRYGWYEETAFPCNCEACRLAYRDALGRDTITGEDLKAPGALYKYVQFRCRNIRSLVEEVRDITNRAGLRLSMAARADYFCWALAEGQDWVEWVADGLVDLVFPMNYFTDRDVHRGHVRQHAALLKGKKGDVPHYDGVGKKSSFGEVTADEMVALAQDALRAGADGVSIFHYNGMNDADFEAIARIVA